MNVDDNPNYSHPTFDPGGVYTSQPSSNNLRTTVEPTSNDIATTFKLTSNNFQTKFETSALNIDQLLKLKEMNNIIYIPHFKSEEYVAIILTKCVDGEAFINLNRRILFVSITGTRKFLMITKVIHHERGVTRENHCCIMMGQLMD